MTRQLPKTAAAYVRAINERNAAGFIELFGADSVVDDAGREFRGRAAIKTWSDREIFGASVTLELIDVVDCDGETVITTNAEKSGTGLLCAALRTPRFKISLSARRRCEASPIQWFLLVGQVLRSQA